MALTGCNAVFTKPVAVTPVKLTDVLAATITVPADPVPVTPIKTIGDNTKPTEPVAVTPVSVTVTGPKLLGNAAKAVSAYELIPNDMAYPSAVKLN
jgi:hypothetical protein